MSTGNWMPWLSLTSSCSVPNLNERRPVSQRLTRLGVARPIRVHGRFEIEEPPSPSTWSSAWELRGPTP